MCSIGRNLPTSVTGALPGSITGGLPSSTLLGGASILSGNVSAGAKRVMGGTFLGASTTPGGSTGGGTGGDSEGGGGGGRPRVPIKPF